MFLLDSKDNQTGVANTRSNFELAEPQGVESDVIVYNAAISTMGISAVQTQGRTYCPGLKTASKKMIPHVS